MILGWIRLALELGAMAGAAYKLIELYWEHFSRQYIRAFNKKQLDELWAWYDEHAYDDPELESTHGDIIQQHPSDVDPH